MSAPILTDREVHILRLAARRLTGSNEEAIERVIAWAVETRTANSLLDGVLSGLIRIVLPKDGKGELRFEIDPAFRSVGGAT